MSVTVGLGKANALRARVYVNFADTLPVTSACYLVFTAAPLATATVLVASIMTQYTTLLQGDGTRGPQAPLQENYTVADGTTYYAYYCIKPFVGSYTEFEDAFPSGVMVLAGTVTFNDVAPLAVLAAETDVDVVEAGVISAAFSLPLAQSAVVFPSLIGTQPQLADAAPTATALATGAVMVSVNGGAAVAKATVTSADTIAFVTASGYGSTYTAGLDVWTNNAYTGYYTKDISMVRSPSTRAINLNRARYAVRAENVLVVYRTDQTGSQTLAQYYQTAESVPSTNVVGITPLFGITDFISTAHALSFLTQISAAIAASNQVIKVILLCGDFPSVVVGWPGADAPFPLLVAYPAFFSGPQTHADFFAAAQSLRSRGWQDTRAMASSRSQTGAINPYFSPAPVDNDCYAVFCLPLSPIADGLAIAQARIDDSIAVGKAGYTTFGTVLLYGATQSNTCCQAMVEEARYITGQSSPTGMHWANLAGEFFGSPGDYAIADHDTNSWATLQPGDTGFSTSKPTDVFLRCPGSKGYYAPPYWTVEQAGDFNYRRGALALFSQSYGATPGSSDFVDTLAVGTIQALTPTIVYGDYDHLASIKATSLRSVSTTFLQLSYGVHGGVDLGATIEVSGAPLSVIGKVSGITKFTVTTSGKSIATIKADVRSAIATANGLGGLWTIVSFQAQGQMSRALAAFRAGAAVTVGVCIEPLADGDIDLHGLYSTLWYGGNIAEWVLRAYGQVSTMPGAGSTVDTIGWYVYGNPLMAPFRQSEVPGATLFPTTVVLP